MIKVETTLFFLFVQKFLSPSVTNLCPAKLNLGYKLKDFFGNARRKKMKFLSDSCLVWQDSLGNAFHGKHFVDTANLHGTPFETF